MTLDYVDASKVLLNDILDETGYTTKYILEKLYENNPKFVQTLNGNQVVKITAYDISEGKGYSARIFKTTVYFDKHDAYTFILKVPTCERWHKMNVDFTEADIEKNKENIRVMHNSECHAYELVRGLDKFPSPKIYYLEFATKTNSGMIIMEDLSKTGVSLGIFSSVTEQHCFNLARHIADFQAYIDFLPEKTWKGKFIDNNIHAKGDIENMWKQMFNPIIESKEDVELAKKCEFFLKINVMELGKYSTEKRAVEIGCTTLVHGDMWTNNMLIKANEDGSISNEILAIIDWQTTFEGNPLFDIARFITNCADAEVRRGCERKVVDFYFDHLTKKYAEHGEKLKFTREEAHELYDIALIQETFLCFIMYAIIAVPLTKSENSADRAKAKKQALRAHLLFDDAMEIMEKRELSDKFNLNKS